MAKRVQRLGGAEVRLLLAAVLCAGFFIASTGVEEWCSVCYPHEGNELFIVNNDRENVRIVLLGPVDWDFTVAAGGSEKIRTRVGLYRYMPGFYDSLDKRWDWERGGAIFVSPDRPNVITIGKAE